MYKSQKQKLFHKKKRKKNVPQEAKTRRVGGRQLGMLQLWNYQKK